MIKEIPGTDAGLPDCQIPEAIDHQKRGYTKLDNKRSKDGVRMIVSLKMSHTAGVFLRHCSDSSRCLKC